MTTSPGGPVLFPDPRTPTRTGLHRHRPNAGILIVSVLASIGIHAAVLKLRFEIRGPEDNSSDRLPSAPLSPVDPIRLIRFTPPNQPQPVTTSGAVEQIDTQPVISLSNLDEPGEAQEPKKAQEPETTIESARDRLVPRAGDLRFWAPVSIKPRRGKRTDLKDGFFAALEALLDSVAAAQGPPEATAWTRVDRGGGLWGVSPGTLHLGMFNIPYCGGGYSAVDCGFGVSPGKLEETQGRRRVHSMIDQSAFRQSMRRVWEKQASKMNSRKEKARKAKKPSGG